MACAPWQGVPAEERCRLWYPAKRIQAGSSNSYGIAFPAHLSLFPTTAFPRNSHLKEIHLRRSCRLCLGPPLESSRANRENTGAMPLDMIQPVSAVDMWWKLSWPDRLSLVAGLDVMHLSCFSRSLPCLQLAGHWAEKAWRAGGVIQ